MTRTTKASFASVLIPVLVVLAVAWGALSLLKSSLGTRTHSTAAVDFKVGAILPDLRFESLDGSSAKGVMLSQSKHKVLLINFWATWCEACMDEMPSLVKLHQEFHSQGFEIYGVNLDEKPQQAIPATVAEFGIPFPNFVDRDEKLSDAFDVHAIPLTIIIDQSRRVLETVAGDRNWMRADFVERLKGWLAQADQAKR
ncbi:MAG: TlpA family protein disulfide reductase [Oligoflexia bacterium]